MAEEGITPIMDEPTVRRALGRMGREIVEKHGGPEGLILMGIRRRGDHLAELLREEIQSAEGVSVPTGALDITLYRDDLGTAGSIPVVGETELPPGGIDDQTVVLVDDVLYTGRTVRAALNELMDYGRPARVLLCVLADLVGRQIEWVGARRVEVRVPALDGRLAVELVDPPEDAS